MISDRLPPASMMSAGRIRLLASFGVASGEAATVLWGRGGTDYKICLDAAFTPAATDAQNS